MSRQLDGARSALNVAIWVGYGAGVARDGVEMAYQWRRQRRLAGEPVGRQGGGLYALVLGVVFVSLGGIPGDGIGGTKSTR